MSLEDYLAIAD
jgi:hypothetical protein